MKVLPAPFPGALAESFAGAEKAIRRMPWFKDRWSCCSGMWKTEKYGDTLVLRLTKDNWSSANPITLEEGGEIQYAAWIDEKLYRRSTVRFEMKVFGFLSSRRIRKGDFTSAFRRRNRAAIESFGHHDIKRGPSVPYAGAYKYQDSEDLMEFIVRDCSNFASLSGSVDEQLKNLSIG